ncbi:H-NS histone family protein [Pelomonas sp. P8]|uniref:H-NS histone family protein n=1 Tax=Pelomonas cellulosilytica TaxID=2906762 RepID=A0ABS8Y4T5_9BURK|nr:H-NS family nucleoid-associated regulatory protein [Pelomonas sp. P8]MCE4558253.1 H-NS histone family protein [Pelomonas sp. P8]
MGKGSTKAAAKAPKSSKSQKPAKYADGAGNTWGGTGKRPDWLR